MGLASRRGLPAFGWQKAAAEKSNHQQHRQPHPSSKGKNRARLLRPREMGTGRRSRARCRYADARVRRPRPHPRKSGFRRERGLGGRGEVAAPVLELTEGCAALWYPPECLTWRTRCFVASPKCPSCSPCLERYCGQTTFSVPNPGGKHFRGLVTCSQFSVFVFGLRGRQESIFLH